MTQQAESLRYVLSHPFRVHLVFQSFLGALPRATLSHPFGVNTRPQYVWSHIIQYRDPALPGFLRPQLGHASGSRGPDAGFAGGGGDGDGVGFGAVDAGTGGFAPVGTGGFAPVGTGGFAPVGTGGRAGACGAGAGAGGALGGSGIGKSSSSESGSGFFAGGGEVGRDGVAIRGGGGGGAALEPVRTVTVTLPTSRASPLATIDSVRVGASSQITCPLRMKYRRARSGAPRAQTVQVRPSPPIFTGSGPRFTVMVSRAP